METRANSLNICQMSFSPSSNKKKGKPALGPFISRNEIAQQELGRTSGGIFKMQKGNIFIPKVIIRPQACCIEAKRSGAKPILPATLNYSKFPQRKLRNSLLRMSMPIAKEKKFNLDSFDPRSTITRHTISMKPNPEEQQTIKMRSCITTTSRERLMRYSQINDGRIHKKIKTIHLAQYFDF